MTDLSALLAKLPQDQAMSLEQIHGFLCAVVSSPQEVPRSQWLPAIFENKRVPDAELTHALGMWHQEIQHMLESQAPIAPYFPDIIYTEATDDQLSSWAAGYMAGILLNQADWLASGHDEIREILLPISSFAAILSGKVSPHGIREKYLAQLPKAIQLTYAFWRQHQACHHHPPQTTVRHAHPKPGRNDPCPCGSGKKFKKCCA